MATKSFAEPVSDIIWKLQQIYETNGNCAATPRVRK